MPSYKENDNKIPAHNGEVLMLLAKRSKMDRDEIARRLGIRPNYLSDCYRRPMLSRKIKLASARVFGVDESIFETGIGYEIPIGQDERVGEAEVEYKTLIKENARLKEENARIAAELLREREVSDDLRRALVLIAGNRSE